MLELKTFRKTRIKKKAQVGPSPTCAFFFFFFLREKFQFKLSRHFVLPLRALSRSPISPYSAGLTVSPDLPQSNGAVLFSSSPMLFPLPLNSSHYLPFPLWDLYGLPFPSALLSVSVRFAASAYPSLWASSSGAPRGAAVCSNERAGWWRRSSQRRAAPVSIAGAHWSTLFSPAFVWALSLSFSFAL